MSLSPSGDSHVSKVIDDDRASTIRQPSLDFSDHEVTDNDHDDLEHPGDYSTRMEELFEDGENESSHGEDEDSDDEENFLYTGADALDMPAGYRDQLRDVLGPELTDDDEIEAHEVERSLVIEESDGILHGLDDEPLHSDILLDHTPSNSSLGLLTPNRVGSPALHGTPSKLARPFLHPNVSRLRSYTPQASQLSSNSAMTSNSHLYDGISPSPSRFSAMSRMSSSSNLHTYTNSSSDTKETPGGHPSRSPQDAFKWTELRNITEHVYNSLSQKLSSVLGTPLLGSPTVLAANGLICVGTDEGKICVYDFKQTLICVCGNESSAGTLGAVTSLALSHDHTYVASGHATGYIQLFDLKNPQSPQRLVPPTTLAAVASGRKEGHTKGSKIISIGFVAGRHTAIVSADDHGLAFSHSLGKVLFVDASDILRILGKYQQDVAPPTNGSTTQSSGNNTVPPPRRQKTRYTILEMAPLPLGTSPHATDQYNVIALLTPTKLVVVGLKPTPRTWFKCVREVDEGGLWRSKSKFKGTMAWYPSVLPHSGSKVVFEKQRPITTLEDAIPTTPSLVYTWGRALHIVRVRESRTKQLSENPRTGKTSEIEVGRIVYEDAGFWSAEDDILSVQWLNANQVIILTAAILQVYDVHISKVVEYVKFDGLSLVSPTLSSTVNGAVSYLDSVGDVSHSLRVYKGKIFLLGRNNMRVGTLLTWADRVLSFVQDGDFLGAIDLATSYYTGDAPGNRNGLPEDPDLLKEVVGDKMRDLMVASARYAFSEDRMTDGTHVTSDGRGVDRTSLFEGLVATSCRSCVALGDFEFLFEDLFQQYDDTGISKIYLRQLEPFVLDNEIRYVPPRITQRLIALHEEDGHPDHAERIIWHIDPACLDINQAIHICQRYGLYDALIYIYTRALHDCVAPVVELLGLIRRVQQYRRSRFDPTEELYGSETMDIMEPVILNAYKIYPYLSNILSGLSYPSEEPLSDDEAYQAKEDIYPFLFSGCSSVWPPGEGAKLILTSDEDGGIEPTYPYARQLLLFDSESFLHTLDIAFEHLNDESRGTSRLVIVRILLEILSSGGLSSSDVTFVNIFIARNAPKYPQYLKYISPTALHGILIGLAKDPNPDTREDRQLAAEYLLSAYNPHESERIIEIFQSAGFYRILRSWHRHERQWAPLLSTYLDDDSLRAPEIFHSFDDVLTISAQASNGSLPLEIIDTISRALPRLLSASISSTAVLVDKHAPELHEEALRSLGDDADSQRFTYLQHLLGPFRHDEYDDALPSLRTGPSLKPSSRLRQLYISLQCRYQPKQVIEALKYLPAELLDWDQVLQTCEVNVVYDAVVWAMNWRGRPQAALTKAEVYQKELTLKTVETLVANPILNQQHLADIYHNVESLESIGHTGIAICLEHSQDAHEITVPLEDIWFQLLSSQINCVQILSGSQFDEPSTNSDELGTKDVRNVQDNTLTSLRALVQATFASLVSVTSTHAVSFPRLFKRLVNSTHTSTNTQYTEFRIILAGMLESYRSDGDMLVITKHLIDRDLFQTVAEATVERNRGWSPSRTTCLYCRKSLFGNIHSETDSGSPTEIVVSRTGTIFHSKCLPPEH